MLDVITDTIARFRATATPLQPPTSERIAVELETLAASIAAADTEHAEASLAALDGQEGAEQRLREVADNRDRLTRHSAGLSAAMKLARAREQRAVESASAEVQAKARERIMAMAEERDRQFDKFIASAGRLATIYRGLLQQSEALRGLLPPGHESIGMLTDRVALEHRLRLELSAHPAMGWAGNWLWGQPTTPRLDEAARGALTMIRQQLHGDQGGE